LPDFGSRLCGTTAVKIRVTSDCIGVTIEPIPREISREQVDGRHDTSVAAPPRMTASIMQGGVTVAAFWLGRGCNGVVR